MSIGKIKSMVGWMLMVILAIVTIAIPLAQSYDDHCVKQYFDQNSFVCVCNVSDCQSIEPATQVPDGYIFIWESSLDKHRLYRTERSVKDLPEDPMLDVGKGLPLVRVQIMINDLRQKIIGFGGAVTDAAGIVISSLPIQLRDHIMLDYFSQNGLDYSLVRVPIAGTDFSTRPYTYDDDHDGDFELKYFNLQPEDLRLKIPIIKRAQELRKGMPIKLLGSAWSPPAWMKTNGAIDGSGFLKGSPGGIYYKTWAKYYVKFLEAYAKYGIRFWGITTGNEPTHALRSPDYFFNNLGLTPENIRDFVKFDLRPALNFAGYAKNKLQLILHDEVKEFMVNYTETVASDKIAGSSITGVAFHWYNLGPVPDYEAVEKIYNRYKNYYLLSTEACEGYKRFSTKRAQLGNWTRAETYASDIIEVLNRGTSGWLDWNIALNTGGGPSWAENWTDGLILVDTDRDIYYRNPMFYSFGHFTKFLKPGSVYVGYKISGNAKGVKLVSFKDPSNQLIVIILNTNDEPVDFIIDNFTVGPIPLRMDPHSIKTLVTPKV